MLELVIEQWQQQHIGEIFAAAFAVAYVWLASEESIWCWPAGFISTCLYAFVFFDVTLIFQMLLNLYYMGMAVYGFMTWQMKTNGKLLISRLDARQHGVILVGGLLLTIFVYYLAVIWMSYTFILLDIAVTVFSLIATYLTVKKRLECWYYWSFINLASIFLYLENALYISVLLMFIYIILAIKGLFIWHNNYNQQASFASSRAV